MKKKLSIILLATFLFLFASCTSEQPELSPYEHYVAATQVVQEAQSISLQMENRILEEYFGEYRYEMLHQSRLGQISDPDKGIELEMFAEMSYLEEGEALQDLDGAYEVYYTDGVLYVRDIAFDWDEKMTVSVELVNIPIRLLRDPFGMEDVLEMEEERIGKGRLLSFTLAPSLLEEWIPGLAIYLVPDMASNMDSINKEFWGYGESAESISYQIKLDAKGLPVECALSFRVEEEDFSLDWSARIDAISLNSVSDIAFPDNLEEYIDYSSRRSNDLDWNDDDFDIWLEEWEAERERLESYYLPVESEYTLINNVSNNCLPLYFLEEQGDSLDYLFWLIYQTQTVVSAPAQPTGFSSPAEISAEGLVRFFCFANRYQLLSFADPEEEIYVIPDSLVGYTMDNYFLGWEYDPRTLPEEFGYESTALWLPFALCEPVFNACRVERVEILDLERLKVTGTGLDRDRETPVNTQELVLIVEEDGGVLFESYAIRPLA